MHGEGWHPVMTRLTVPVFGGGDTDDQARDASRDFVQVLDVAAGQDAGEEGLPGVASPAPSDDGRGRDGFRGVAGNYAAGNFYRTVIVYHGTLAAGPAQAFIVSERNGRWGAKPSRFSRKYCRSALRIGDLT